MDEEKEFYKELSEIELEYFRKNFDGKDLFEALHDTFMKEFKNFSRVYMRFLVLSDILAAVKESQSKGMCDDQIKILDSYIGGIDVLSNEMESIIEVILNP